MLQYTTTLFGMLAITQSFFVPGILILRGNKFKGSVIQKLVYTVALSLISSYLLVILLVFLNLYLQVVVLSIFTLEIIAIIWLFQQSSQKSVFHTLQAGWKNVTNTLLELVRSWSHVGNFASLVKTITSLVAFTLSLALLWWSIKLAIHYTGTIFDLWDTIVSWNEWALEWAAGSMPVNTRNYPQLLPANYSLVYVFMGNTEIQFFAKFLILPMAFLILLMPFDLGLKTKKGGYFLATILIYLLLKKFLITELTSGYVDGMMAFFRYL